MNIWMRIYLTLIFCLWLSSPCYGQAGRMFTVDDRGLSSSLINGIYQDRRGLIWIATEDGLNVYDGAKIVSFKHDQNDASSLINNYVQTVFEDSNNNFYVGTLSGLQLYDYRTGTFSTILMELQGGGFVYPNVTSVFERKDGIVLVSTSGYGIFEIDKNADTKKAMQARDPMRINLVTCMFEDDEANLWVATENKGLFRLTQYVTPLNFPDENGNVWNNITSLCQDKYGNIYAGTIDKGVYVLSKGAEHFVQLPYQVNRDMPVKALFMAWENELYIGTDGRGLKVYNIDEHKFSDSQFNINAFDLNKSKIYSLIKDTSGNLWLGFYQKGVMLIPSSINEFKYIGSKSVTNDQIGSNCVISLHKDHTGTLWVGTDNDGLYAIGQDGRQKVHYQHSASNPRSVPSTVSCIFEDSNNNIWLGSQLEGMARFNATNGGCEYVDGLIDSKSNIVKRVLCFAEDNDKRLWIGTMGSGLYYMNLRNGKITRMPDNDNGAMFNEEENVLHNLWINCLTISRNGKLYIGTYDGVGCLDLETEDFVSTYRRNRLLAGKAIYTIFEDKNGNIWAGSSDGLFKIDKNNGATLHYTVSDGLPGNVVCAIHGDSKGNLWISTDYGMSRFNITKGIFDNYYASNGLQGNEFSKGASYSDNTNEIYFGGSNGITYFSPKEIKNMVIKPEIHITGFYLYNHSVKYGSKSGSRTIIDTSLDEAKRFNFAHKDNTFTIEFSTMEFNNPERISYMYRMNNDKWTNLLPGSCRVSFSNMSVGTYRFEVMAKDYTAMSDVKHIDIVIRAAWYASVVAKIFYVILVLFIINFVISSIKHRYALQQKMLEHQHAEEMNEAKLQFFINISHEIRTPMSLIISPLQKLITTDKDPVHQKSYHTIYRNSQRILNLINQMMDVRKIDKGQMTLKFRQTDIVEFIKELCNAMEYQMSTKGIKLNMHYTEEHINAWIDPQNFDKIILNLLSNAFKFVPQNGNIDIFVSTTEEDGRKMLEISVKDNGIGIDESETAHIFERFYQVRNSQNSQTTGTGIGLNLARMLVELHHGTISVTNNENGGCSFNVKMPLGNDHLRVDELDRGNDEVTHNTGYLAILPEEKPLEPRVKAKTSHRILIVEDDDEIRNYLMTELADYYHVSQSRNGKEALTSILKCPPDLVISDIMMPEMDGITLCHKIKQNININRIPVVLLTAKIREQDNIEGLNAGADAYIPKPFSMEILRTTIENILHSREVLRNVYTKQQEQEERIPALEIQSTNDKLLDRIMNVINRNIDTPELSVEMIASEVGISRVHLHRKLKELTNQTTRDLIRNVRLKQAAVLLTEKHYNVSETAYLTGFTHITIFSRAFKEFYGVAPTAYAAEYASSHEESADGRDADDGGKEASEENKDDAQ